MATKLKFTTGIEIETNSGYIAGSLVPEAWSQGVDMSCGLEFRSAKLEDVETLVGSTEKVCDAINMSGLRAGHNCGLHVHIGFKQIGDLSAKYRLFRFVSVYEDLFFDLMPPWHTRAHYCQKLSPATWASFQRGEGFNWWKSETSRYWWFNGAAMFRHGTVEFRHMNGTTNSAEILGWVAVLQCMFQATVYEDVKLPWRDTGRANPAQLIEDLRCRQNALFGQQASAFIRSR